MGNRLNHKIICHWFGFHACRSPNSVRSKSQTTVAHSTTEAESTAAIACAKTALYLHSILEEIGLPPQYATKTYEENAAAIEIANA